MNLPPPLPTDITRRRWAKQFMLCSAAALIGPRWIAGVLAEVTTNALGSGSLRLKPTSFPVLADIGGSVQLKFIDGVAPLTLNRVSEDRFVTLDTICTHSGCTVGRYQMDSRTNSLLMRCPCHGSRYDIEGRVFRNSSGESTEPAPDDLGRFKTDYDGDAGIITISIPGLTLQMDAIQVHDQQGNGDLRLKLVFPVTYGAVYQIHYQPDLTTPPQVTPFSTTPDGAANQTIINPENDGNFTAYVDASGQRGFFNVGLILTPIF